MKIAVIGPGAMGCLFAAFFAEAGGDVWLLDHDPDRAKLLNEEGLSLDGVSGSHHVRVPVSADPAGLGRADLILVCVKSYDTPRAAEIIAPSLTPGAMVLTLQNGLGNVEALSERLGAGPVLAGVTAQGANLLAPGRVHHAGAGETVIGELSGEVTPRLRKLVSLFNSAGLPARETRELRAVLWGKLILNAAINPLAALLRVRNGALLRPPISQLMQQIIAEAAAVAHAAGIALPYSDPVARARQVCEDTAQNINSMLQDVLHQRCTEVEAINGAIVTEGNRLGLTTPLNGLLGQLLTALQAAYAHQKLEERG